MNYQNHSQESHTGQKVIEKIAIIIMSTVAVTTSCSQLKKLAPFSTPEYPLEIGSTVVSSVDKMTLVYVPEGDFPMGSEVGLTDEQPVHTVFLDSFWIDKTEVTNAMYGLCVKSGKCEQPSVITDFNNPDYSNHPVVYVSWVDAKAYCSWAGRRLPTEAEWEKAASWDPVNNKKRIYPWGDQFDCTKANFDDETLEDDFFVNGGPHCDGYDRTSPVGSFPSGASPYGALDMAGNVWEWVNDAFIETDPFGDTKNYYAISPASNPPGVDPSITAYRVLRGSSWNLNFGFGRAAYRLWFGLYDSYDFTGFRCANSTSNQQ